MRKRAAPSTRTALNEAEHEADGHGRPGPVPSEDVPARNREISVFDLDGYEVEDLAVGRAPSHEKQELAALEPASSVERAPEVPAEDVSLRRSTQAAPDLWRERRRERNESAPVDRAEPRQRGGGSRLAEEGPASVFVVERERRLHTRRAMALRPLRQLDGRAEEAGAHTGHQVAASCRRHGALGPVEVDGAAA